MSALTRRLARLLLVGATVLALAGCGGEDGGDDSASVPDSAQLAPADASVFLAFDTDLEGEQWRQAETLLDRFPSGDKLLTSLREELADEDVSFERDVKPALGPEVGVVVFDIGSDDPAVVLYTQPRDQAKLEALLAKGDEEVVTRDVEGWTVAAETQAELDRFTQGRERGVLADEGDFKDAMGDLEEDAMLAVYVGGEGVRNAVKGQLGGQLAMPGLTEGLDRFRAFALAASAEAQGFRFDALVARDGGLELGEYAPVLDEEVPGKPLFFLSAANLDDPARQALDAARESIPSFASQLAQFERALGLSLEDDVIALLDGELALAVYPETGGPLPVAVDLLLAVDDEAKAERLMERLEALAELGDVGQGSATTIAGVDAHELRFTGEDFSIFWAVSDGKLAVASSPGAFEKLHADSGRLADDPAYGEALETAGVPDRVGAIVYSDIAASAPSLLELAGDDEEIQELRANLAALRWAIFYGSGDRFSGFVRIE